jgi:hypothetical protein
MKKRSITEKKKLIRETSRWHLYVCSKRLKKLGQVMCKAWKESIPGKYIFD